MENYRVAVIGRTGRGNYGHGLDVVWKDVPRTQVVAVADDDDQGRAEAARRLNVSSAYADYRVMLEKERPQIVSVAPRWLDAHLDMVLACAEFGCHIFLEKPMSRTLAEADQMIAACEQAHVKHVIAHQTRYSPRLQRIKELIRQGTIGDVLELRGRGKEDRRGGGEDLMVLGTHIMDLMRSLGGDPQWCFGRVYENGSGVKGGQVREGAEGIGPLAGDEIHATYRFKSPTMGYFSTHRTRHGSAQRFGLQIHGSRGIISMTTGSLPAVHILDDPSWSPGSSGRSWREVTSAGIGKPEPLEDSGHHLANVLIAKDLIGAIETDAETQGSLYDGRAALEMILAVYESHRLQSPVKLPLENRKHPLRQLS